MRFTTQLHFSIAGAALAAALVMLTACNTSGLSKTPRATFSQLACLDVNGDNRINGADAADPSKVPDFNADDKHDERDAAFLQDVDIALDPARQPCDSSSSKRAPEYLVAHGYFKPSDVSCNDGDKPVLLVGIGGGVVNLREKDDAAGIRSIVDGLQKKYDDNDIATIGVIAGPAVVGATNVHTAMETWLTHAVQVYLDRFPCLRTVLVGHSHGGVTADVVGAHLEGEYGERIIAVVDVDRVDELYTGDLSSRPTRAPVLNIFETTDGRLHGDAYESPNAENVNANDITGPEHGEQGGAQKPVNHTTIDNSAGIRKLIADGVMKRSGL